MEELRSRHPGRLGADGADVLRYNVAIVGRFFIKRSWVSEAWRKEHPEEIAEELGPPVRIATTEERRERLSLEHTHEGSVCAASGHATSTRGSVDVR